MTLGNPSQGDKITAESVNLIKVFLFFEIVLIVFAERVNDDSKQLEILSQLHL